MKRTIFGLATILVVFLTVLAVLVVHPARKAKAHHGCSNRTLMGNYGWTEFGYEPEEDPVDSWTAVGLVHFDGNGHFTGTQGYIVKSGVLTGPGGTTAGTYHVDSDCTILITYDFESETYTIHGVVVGPHGSEIKAVGSSSGSDLTASVDVKKIADQD